MSPSLPTTAKPVGLGKSVAWSIAIIATLPVTLAVLWGVGYLWGKGAPLVTRIGITWSQVWIGLAVIAGYAVILTAVHVVRTYRARNALYATAQATFTPDGVTS